MGQIEPVECGSTDSAPEVPATSNLTPAHVSLMPTGDISSSGTDYLHKSAPHCSSTDVTVEDLDRLLTDAVELMQTLERAEGNEEEYLPDTLPQQEIPQQEAPRMRTLTSKQRDSHRRTNERRKKKQREGRQREGGVEGALSGRVGGGKLEGREQQSSGSRQRRSPKKKSKQLDQKAGELTEVDSVGQKRKATEEEPRTPKRAKVNPPSLPVTQAPPPTVSTNSQRRRYRRQRGMQFQAAKASRSR